MTIIMLLWWSLGRGNPVVPSRWQATSTARVEPYRFVKPSHRITSTPDHARQQASPRPQRNDETDLVESTRRDHLGPP
jgi:hypothetical protein